ncbi:MAG: hypothetical protein GTO54_10000 [Nitrososphaeria archaeon]|nr:hypothetical protein [Nitrososphaeria archaeon]
MKALFTLSPTESKRLIAKGAVKSEVIQKARDEGLIAVSWSTTNAYVAEELLGKTIDKEKYCAGLITKGVTCATSGEKRPPMVILDKGRPVNLSFKEALSKFKAGDVYVKGANAIDPFGVAGILLAGETGGTIGAAIGTIMARGAKLVIPVGLEKMIPSVTEASRISGIHSVDYSIGASCGVMPLTNCEIITEMEALEYLADVEAIPISAGGQREMQGSVVMLIEGPDENVQTAIEIVEKIKGEEPVHVKKRDCETCDMVCNFAGKRIEELPPYLR